MGLRHITADENLRLELSLTCTAPAVRLQVQVLGGLVGPTPANTCTCSAVQVSLDSGATVAIFRVVVSKRFLKAGLIVLTITFIRRNAE